MHGSSSRRKQPLNPTSPLRTLVLRTSYYLTVARDLQPGWLSLSLERHAAVRNGTNKPYWHLGAARSSSPFLSRMKRTPSAAPRPDQLSPCPLWLRSRSRSSTQARIWCARDRPSRRPASHGRALRMELMPTSNGGLPPIGRLEEHGYHHGRCHQDGN
jgi:hypothetical protein